MQINNYPHVRRLIVDTYPLQHIFGAERSSWPAVTPIHCSKYPAADSMFIPTNVDTELTVPGWLLVEAPHILIHCKYILYIQREEERKLWHLNGSPHCKTAQDVCSYLGFTIVGVHVGILPSPLVSKHSIVYS